MNALNTATSAPSLDDSALTERITTLLRSERAHTVEFLRHLAEFDARKLYLGQGFPSMYEYCRDGLKLSDGSAFRRYTVARLMVRFPVIAEFLEDGRLTLTRVAELRYVLTEDNHLDLLTRATHGTERDVEVLARSLRPKPDVTDGIRKLPERTVAGAVSTPAFAPMSAPSLKTASVPAATLVPLCATAPITASAPTSGSSAPTEPATADRTNLMEPTDAALNGHLAAPPVAQSLVLRSADSQASASPLSEAPASAHVPMHVLEQTHSLFGSSTADAPQAAPARRMKVEATSATAFSVRMSVGPEFLAEFEAVKAELSHKIPDGNFEDIFRECFRITLEVLQRRRAPKPSRCPPKPRTEDAGGSAEATTVTCSKEAEPSRHIPANVERAVWARDGGSCAFIGANGRRCNSRHQVQVHHKVPFASGGPSTAENLSLRCRAHNLYEAELAFGTEFMKAKTDGVRRTRARGYFHRWKWNDGEAKSGTDARSGRDPAKEH